MRGHAWALRVGAHAAVRAEAARQVRVHGLMRLCKADARKHLTSVDDVRAHVRAHVRVTCFVAVPDACDGRRVLAWGACKVRMILIVMIILAIIIIMIIIIMIVMTIVMTVMIVMVEIIIVMITRGHVLLSDIKYLYNMASKSMSIIEDKRMVCIIIADIII